MALSKREKNLAITTGVLVLPFAIWLVMGALGGSTKLLRAQKANLVNEINKAKDVVRKGHEAQKQLDEWNQQALPQDVESAGSRYKIWLMELSESDQYNARFQNTQVKPLKNQPIGEVGTYLSFNVSGVASLERLTRWLYGFYSADYLQQIKALTITPIEESKKLNLVIQIEALALKGATDLDGKPRSDALQDIPEDAIDEELLDKYCETIGQRAIFSRYSPPPPERPPEKPREEPSRPLFDHGKFTRITGITEVDGQPAVWIRLMTSGKDLRLFEGETFDVGPVKAKVVRIEIEGRTVMSEVEGKQYMLALGDNMRDAKEIGAASPSDTPSDAPVDLPQETPADMPSDMPTDAPAETPSVTPEAAPAETPSEAPADAPAETPSVTPEATPAETPSEAPADTPAETPSETPEAAPAETPSEAPSDAPAETPSEAPADTPAPSA
jgi:hypothetical protein